MPRTISAANGCQASEWYGQAQQATVAGARRRDRRSGRDRRWGGRQHQLEARKSTGVVLGVGVEIQKAGAQVGHVRVTQLHRPRIWVNGTSERLMMIGPLVPLAARWKWAAVTWSWESPLTVAE